MTRPSINLCIVCLDALRYDHVTPEIMPRVSELAAGGRTYSEVRTAATWTVPSVAAMLIGRDNAFADGPDAAIGMPSIAGRLARTHASGAFLGNMVIRIESGQWVFGDFEYVDAYDDAPDRRRVPHDVIVDGWRAWRGQATPWLAYMHFIEPHEPLTTDIGPAEDDDVNVRAHLEQGIYTAFRDHVTGKLPLSEEAQDYIRSKYAAYCGELDGWLRDLCEEILDGQTLLLITADHGEALGEGGVWGHGWTDMPNHDDTYRIDAVQRVPFILLGPGVEASRDQRHLSNAALPEIAIDQLRASMGVTPTSMEDVASQLEALGYMG